MMTWEKHQANPVIPATPAGLDLIGFRDPFLWKEEDGRWYMLLGSGIKGAGGVALLYRSPDLIEWEYLNPLYIGDPAESGINWECPNFLDLGAKHMLVVSPHGRPVYWLLIIDSLRTGRQNAWTGVMFSMRPTACLTLPVAG